MPGRGRAPKPPHQRRNRTPPQRGEWAYLPPLQKPVLPPLPKRRRGEGAWSARTRAAWRAWRSDRVTGEYSPADVQAAIDLAYLYEDWVRGANLAGEVRQWLDRLGLNPKGKRDLRRLVSGAETVAEPEPPRARRTATERRARLSVVK